MTLITCPVAQMAHSHPQHLAIEGVQSVSYDQLNNRIRQWHTMLRPLAPGEVVVYRMVSPLDEMAIMWACFRAGLIAYPLSKLLDYDGICHAIQLAQAAVMVSDLAIPEPFPVPTLTPSELETGEKENDTLSMDQPCLLVATSGTTGEPRLALSTVGQWVWNAMGVLSVFPMTPQDKVLLCLPRSHMGGIGVVCRTMMAGATLVIPHQADALSDIISGITHVSLVPTQLQQLAPNSPPSTLRSLLVGGADLRPELATRYYQWPIQAVYGCTEMGSTVAIHTPSGWDPLPYREMRITANGWIQLKGETLFSGYYHPPMVRLALTHDGWFETHDRITPETDNRISRGEEWVNSGGESISVMGIESVLQGVCHSCLVVGVDDDMYGERPIIMVQNPQDRVFWDKVNTLKGAMKPLQIVDWHPQINPHEKTARLKLKRLYQQKALTPLKQEGSLGNG